MINQARALLAENGIVIKQGPSQVRLQLPAIVDDAENGLSQRMRRLLGALYEHIVSLETSIVVQDRELRTIAKEHEACKRLMKVPGVGFMTATILLTMTGTASDFKSERQFTAYLGLVPRQYSTGESGACWGSPSVATATPGRFSSKARGRCCGP